MHFYLNTYAPLATSPLGLRASRDLGLPPFIDGSCRREPDLEHQYPSISCLCRADKFAPRLKRDDHIAYLTRKDRYGEVPGRHRRLSAILRVTKCFDSHAEAAAWYQDGGLALPSNCLVDGNHPMPLEMTHQESKGLSCVTDANHVQLWDREYQKRAKQNPRFVVCRPVFRKLSWAAPVVEDADLKHVFGYIPGTQNPGKLEFALLDRFAARLKIRLCR